MTAVFLGFCAMTLCVVLSMHLSPSLAAPYCTALSLCTRSVKGKLRPTSWFLLCCWSRPAWAPTMTADIAIWRFCCLRKPFLAAVVDGGNREYVPGDMAEVLFGVTNHLSQGSGQFNCKGVSTACLGLKIKEWVSIFYHCIPQYGGYIVMLVLWLLSP